MIPKFSPIYEELPEYYVHAPDKAQNVVILYEKSKININKEGLDTVQYLFEWANRQGLQGYLTHDVQFNKIKITSDFRFDQTKISCQRKKFTNL